MCGIAGLMNWADGEALSRMVATLRHRGPDDAGTWERSICDGSWVGLGSRRLAILDLSPAGHMPMTTEDGLLTITYNGEIYNYPALRRLMEDKGYVFRSHSDTEAILYLYREYGPECVKMLNGMFAIAIWDDMRRELFLARDHFGIKPLYFCHKGNQLAFASEAKALLVLTDISRDIDVNALRQYLTFLWVPEPLTLFDEVKKFPAGHYAVFKNGLLTTTQYWDLHFPAQDVRFETNEAVIEEELRERFIKSVRSQLLSDVPLGAFLSAGLDSSSIVAAMAMSGDKPVSTFTITFPPEYRRGEILDDAAVAQRTAEHFGCDHTEIIVRPDVAELLPKLVWHMDDPTADPAIIAAYLVCREARASATVLLSGIGGDEMFAGYRKYRAHELSLIYQRIPQMMRQRMLEPLLERSPAFRGTPIKGYMHLAKKMARSGSLSPRERFIDNSVYLSPAEQERLFTPEVYRQCNRQDPLHQHLDCFDQVADVDFLNQMLYVDSKMFMPSLNLSYNDRMSMASSVEVRVPFLDHELAEWVATTIPPHLKLRGAQTKAIFRQAMKPLLPDEVLRQRKAGFAAPIDHWLAHDLRCMVDEVLHPDVIARRGLFRPEIVAQYIKEQRSGRRDWSYQIWTLLTLELWMRTFVDA